ncbi:hypothetical protein TEK04_12775 [Klenkia sp. LSe6-5]|uniref:RanBP2-type domain-containing protein n=1 Tax=Klenkia sesuvii TaxID=3103137 RepID=A0ABU8DX32_9ACTN
MLHLDARTTAPAPTRGAWTCANCPTTNEAHRKRCTDCGTTRH